MQKLFEYYSVTALLREQLLVSFFGFKSVCKHRPTCSQFTQEQIKERGIVMGSLLGLRRVLSCW